jgi:large subunit ribosomal protein L24
MNIKKDNNVIVLVGKDKGKTGKVLKMLPKQDRLIVSGLNIVKKHQKPRQKGQKGQLVEVSMPIHISNVALESEYKKGKSKK